MAVYSHCFLLIRNWSNLGTLFFDLNPSMEKINNQPSGLKKVSVEGIEVRVWEIYLLRSRKNLYNALSSYSLDKGVFQKAGKLEDRISFRFTRYDWTKSIQPLLQEHYIPFEVVNSFTLEGGNNFGKKKVYIAEDDLNTLFAMNNMLEDAGYDVLLAHCGQPMLEPNLPATDLFILDKMMPGVDGIQICKHLRKQRNTKDVPVIMISAGRISAREAHDAGVTDFLEKPFKMHALLALVAKHTARE